MAEKHEYAERMFDGAGRPRDRAGRPRRVQRQVRHELVPRGRGRRGQDLVRGRRRARPRRPSPSIVIYPPTRGLQTQGDPFEPVKIGVLVDMDLGQLLADWIDPTILAIEDALNEGVWGRSPVAIITADARGLPRENYRKVIDGYKWLVEQGCVVILGPMISDNCLTLQPVADEIGVPVIGWTGAHKFASDYCYTVANGDIPTEGVMCANWLYQRGLEEGRACSGRSARRGATTPTSSATRRCASGSTITREVKLEPNPRNMKENLADMRDMGTEGIYYGGYGYATFHFAEAFQALDWDPPRVMGTAFMFYSNSNEWAEGLEGWHGVDQLGEDGTNPNYEAMVKRFKARFGRETRNVVVALAYDTARAAIHGIANAAIPTPRARATTGSTGSGGCRPPTAGRRATCSSAPATTRGTRATSSRSASCAAASSASTATTAPSGRATRRRRRERRAHGLLPQRRHGAQMLEEQVLPPALERVDLGDDVLEIGPGPGFTTDVARARRTAHLDRGRDRSACCTSRSPSDWPARTSTSSTATRPRSSCPTTGSPRAASFNMLHHVPTAEAQDAIFAELAARAAPRRRARGRRRRRTARARAEFHEGDTYNPIDPDVASPAGSRTAGFTDIEVELFDLGWICSTPGRSEPPAPSYAVALAASSPSEILAGSLVALVHRLLRHVVARGLGAQRADGALLLGAVRERVEAVPAHRVLVRDLVEVGVGDRVRARPSRSSSSGAFGPRRVGVRVVLLPADVVDADLVAQREPDRVGDEAREDVLAEHVGRHPVAEVLAGPQRGACRRCGRAGRGSTGSSRCRPRRARP